MQMYSESDNYWWTAVALRAADVLRAHAAGNHAAGTLEVE
jgi:hypothetical protein